jgi:methionyl-tRNA synthetase
MADHILIGVAWPYANNYQHIGHLSGVYLPADVFARFHRLLGNDVIMVSGSDTHGSPVSIAAHNKNTTTQSIYQKYHNSFLDSYKALGISFDLFTHTDSENHWKISQDIFKKIYENGYLLKKVQKQLFDNSINMFLADRYIEGTCPLCGYKEARGDQCDNCSKTYDPMDLIDPISKLTGSKDLIVKESEHFFLNLPKLKEKLLSWTKKNKSHWRSHVLNFTLSQLDIVEPRAITRDIDWGINLPLKGYEKKVLYVWFEAVIGYYSASVELSNLNNSNINYKKWWSADNQNTKQYYFMGKDNITFHSIIWPAITSAYGDLILPYDIVSSQYLNIDGSKISKSKGISIKVKDVINKFDIDIIRYVLISMSPENSDSDFNWQLFFDKANNELIANWGNLVNRVLDFVYKRFDAYIPEIKNLRQQDKNLLNEIKSRFEKVTDLYKNVKLKAALEEINSISKLVNKYLNENQPWKLLKDRPDLAKIVLYTALQSIYWINLMWYPIIPDASEKLNKIFGNSKNIGGNIYIESVKDKRGVHDVLRYDHSSAYGKWVLEPLKSIKISKPSPLFKKII